jgi:hypothetical protein
MGGFATWQAKRDPEQIVNGTTLGWPAPVGI